MTTLSPNPNLGTQQSPITLSGLTPAEIGVEIGWDALALNPVADGYNPPRKLKASATRKTAYLRVDGERFVPVDMHWHFPAEHHLGNKGRIYDSEAHIVHIHKDDVPWALQGRLDHCRIAVLGVFLKSGREPYEPFTVAGGGLEGKPVKVAREDILPEDLSAIRYNGSLTTPPYSENVTFIIFNNPRTATRKQLADDDLPNARPIQGRNRRYCLLGDVTCK
ncbi:MAG: carbonic anhydrase family protein [Myxococcota bacterium]